MTVLVSGASALEKSVVHLRVQDASGAMPAPKADHYSYSRLNRYATCPLSFKLHYLDGLESEPAVELLFGTVIHRALETLVREHVRQNRVMRICVGDAARAFRREWTDSPLSDPALFAEGLAIVERWALREGIVDYRNVLGVEQEFDVRIDGHRIIGAMDRVDRINENTIRVRDYKSHRVLFTQDEVDASLQLSIYDLAARQLWPWAENVELELDMVRHGVAQRTSRNQSDRWGTENYVVATIQQIELATAFPPRPNTHCNRCDHRKQCPAYAEALAGKREFICTDHGDLVAIGREREEVARLAKILYGRKDELDNFLRAALEKQEAIEANGVTICSRTRSSRPPTTTREHSCSYIRATTIDALTRSRRIARASASRARSLHGRLKTLSTRFGVTVAARGSMPSPIGTSRSGRSTTRGEHASAFAVRRPARVSTSAFRKAAVVGDSGRSVS